MRQLKWSLRGWERKPVTTPPCSRHTVVLLPVCMKKLDRDKLSMLESTEKNKSRLRTLFYTLD